MNTYYTCNICGKKQADYLGNCLFCDDKIILDACCGGKTFWLDKQHPNTIYIDIRTENKGYCPERPNFNIKPDIIADFRNLPFPDKKFKLIMWDPPHFIHKDGMKKLGGFRLIKKYGALHAETWRDDLRKGFNELWRVLDDDGVLIFKFHDQHIQHKEVLSLFHTKPLFGTTTKQKKGYTCKWFTFIKLKEEK